MSSKRGCHVLGLLLAAGFLGVWPQRGLGADADLFGRRIAAVELECAAPIDVAALQRLMPMRVGGVLRPQDLEEARRRLAAKDVFTRIDVDTQPRGELVAVIIHLVRKAIIDRVRFEGNDTLSDRELRRVVRLRESMAMDDQLRDYSVRRLHERYVEEGFEAVRVGADVRTRAPGEVDVTFRIQEGEPVRVGAIVVDSAGTMPVSQGEIRKAARIDVGDRRVRERQRAAEKAIMSLFRDRHYYEVQVESKWERQSEKSGTLRFRIEAGPPFDVSFSGNHHFSDKKLLALMDFPQRPIVTDGSWRELARRAQRKYQQDSYYFARVELTIEAGTPKAVRFTIDEGQRFHVGAVRFKGDHALSGRQLRAPMATRPPNWIPWRRGVLLDDVLDDDLKRLWYLYRRHGFESAEILDAQTRFDRDRGRVFITIVIEEGRQTIVRRIERSGVEPIAGNLPELAVTLDKPLDTDKVEADRQALVTALATAGYTHAEVKATVTTQLSGEIEAATVRFEAVPGEQQRVGAIIVQNNLDTHAGVILRELPFKEGDPLDPRALLRGQDNIYKLGLFRSVTVRPLEPAPDAQPNRADVAVTVSERPPGAMQWGAGYNTRDGFRGFLEVSHDNLEGLARRASARGEFSLEPGDFVPNEYLGNLGFREPRLDGTGWTFRTNLIGQRSTRKVDQFSFERFALIPAIERTILPGLQSGMELQIEQAQVFDLAPDVVAFNPRDQGRLRTLSLGPFAVYDGRDDAFVPRRGVFDSLRLRIAPEQLGSDIPFVKLFGEHTQYIPVDEDFTFLYVARAGWARTLGGSDIVPIRERFFLGGRTTVRGFSENQIGPKGYLNNPLGGDLALNLNTEFRYPLMFGFGGVVFADGGGVYLQDRSVSIHDFRRSTGLGLRYITPVGPISLEYGFKLDRRTDESLGEVHFSVGTVF